MPDKTSRATRRYHRERLLKRAIKKHTEAGWFDTPEQILWMAHRTWNNMTNCSCDGCCNERRSIWNQGLQKLTLQERKALDSYKQQLEEVDNLKDLPDNMES